MFLKIIVSIILIILRLLVGVKVISWIILNLIAENSHPISEIEIYLVIMLLDVWITNQGSDIIIINGDKD